MKPSGLPTCLGLLFAAAATVSGSHFDSHRLSRQNAHKFSPRQPGMQAKVVTVTEVATPAATTAAPVDTMSSIDGTVCLDAVTLTTTVDVTTTIYANFGNSTITVWGSSTAAPMPTDEPCDDETVTISTTVNGTPTTYTTTVAATQTEEPCDDVTSTVTTTVNGTPSTYITTVAATTTEEPCHECVPITVTATINGTPTTITTTVAATMTEEPCDDVTSTITATVDGTVSTYTTTVAATKTEEPCECERITVTATVNDAVATYTITVSTTQTADATAYPIFTGTPGPWSNSTVAPIWVNSTSASPTSTEPCDDDDMTTTGVPLVTAAPTWYNSTVLPIYVNSTSTLAPIFVNSTSSAAPIFANSTSSAVPTSTEPCDDDDMTTTGVPLVTAAPTGYNSTVLPIYVNSTSTLAPVFVNSTSSAVPTSTEDCDDDDMTTTVGPSSTAAPIVSNSTLISNSSLTSTDLPSSTGVPSSTAEPIFINSTSSAATVRLTISSAATATITPFTTIPVTSGTPLPTIITELPVSTATVETTTTFSLPPTTTVDGGSAPTGTPLSRAVHCGVHGLPVGDYFLGEFVESEANVPVTLESCWQLCSANWGTTHGCASYDFYLNDLGAPRCDLYGSPVAYALASVDNNEPNTWFDLACGNPTAQQWEYERNSTSSAYLRRGRRAVLRW